jgi:GNAT superfamily N-acetyltransferase
MEALCSFVLGSTEPPRSVEFSTEKLWACAVHAEAGRSLTTYVLPCSVRALEACRGGSDAEALVAAERLLQWSDHLDSIFCPAALLDSGALRELDTVPVMRMVAFERGTAADVPKASGEDFRAVLPSEPQLVELASDWLVRFNEEVWGTPTVARIGSIREDAARTIAEGNVLMLHRDSKPVGMGVFRGETPHAVRIGGLYVPPELRGAGVGKDIVSGLILEAGRRGKERVGVFADSASARNVYLYGTHGAFDRVCEMVLLKRSSSS